MIMKKLLITLSISAALVASAKENAAVSMRQKQKDSQQSLNQRVMSACAAARGSAELKTNNVRTIIYTGGDMWWDQFGSGNARYIIPKVEVLANGISSSFAGSIWLGGLDAGGTLKVAAMTYRQNGSDFWPGPLDITNASADPAVCSQYDQLFRMTRAEVDNMVLNGSSPSASILNWPGNGDFLKNQDPILAPFVDVNNNGIYEPTSGDYPSYDVFNRIDNKDDKGFCKAKLFGDETLFWVFNDKGDVHTETQGVAIGVEIRAQAFAFKTNDEINNMTFYSYEIHNRSSFQLNKTYFTIWNDADLGYYLDDYVGCDVGRGLGYIYNADPFDETAAGTNGYGDFPPALGCDFFKGPLADLNDGIDNDFDASQSGQFAGTDEKGETIQMSRFTYYNNNIGAFPPQTTNPDIAIHYYNFMTGFWKDGSPFTFGNNAYGGTLPYTFVYDGDPVNNTGWTEKNSGNLPGDRRFLQSAGPFTLKPGAVNDITFGMPWAQAPTKGGNIESIRLLRSADDKAQALFDACFKILDGPEAPNMTIQEMDKEMIFYLTNKRGSNNYKQFNNDYNEEDISIVSDPTSTITALSNPDKFYKFEGYIVYQVRDAGVSSTDLSDRTKAIPVFQCDIKNGVSRLINFEQDNNVGQLVPKIKVEGNDNGVVSTFKLTEDAFSTLENRKFVNNKTYYFVSVAYAYNNYLTYAPDVPVSVNPAANVLGQKRTYLEGRNIKRAAGIPHITDTEKDGTISQAAYGFGPKITRIEGQGNGGNFITLTKASEDAILANNFVPEITYENGKGPINVKVVDPLNVINSNFQFKLRSNLATNTGTAASTFSLALPTTTAGAMLGDVNADLSSWELYDVTNNKYYYPTPVNTSSTISGGIPDNKYQPIRNDNEVYFPELGLSITLKQVADPGEKVNSFTDYASLKNYAGLEPGTFLGASLTYENGTANWLIPQKDADGVQNPTNWILSGTTKFSDKQNRYGSDAYYNLDGAEQPETFVDPTKQFGNILEGTWAPYTLCSSFYRLAANVAGGNTRCFGGPALSGYVWKNDDAILRSEGLGITATDVYGLPGTMNPNEGASDLRRLSSVVIVYTKDKSKWTRCPVIEMQERYTLSEGNAVFFSPRNHASIDKQGISFGAPGCNTAEASITSTASMGWFPGYAISIETGERLNMMYGEDSYQKENNGDDMIWNPTNSSTGSSFSMGGKHFVYVFSANAITGQFRKISNASWQETSEPNSLIGNNIGSPRYDQGAHAYNILSKFFRKDPSLGFPSYNAGNNAAPIECLTRDIMWVSMPMVRNGFIFKDPANMPSDVRIQINVTKPYRFGYTGIVDVTNNPAGTSLGLLNKLVAVRNFTSLTTFTASNPQNGNLPMYKFNTSDIASLFGQTDVAKNSLDLIKVVPNPYYGSSSYETKRIDNRVRITNLPNKCTVKIFTMNGTLVRTLKRDVSDQEDIGIANTEIKQSKRIPYMDWDLKNQNNISVASGLYIFHIDAPGIGEKIVKWFGVMRPLDVQNY